MSAPQQNITSTAGFAYGAIGADIHVFGDGTPLYVLQRWQPAPEADAEWLRELPSRMLNARYALVEFTGREAELAQLRQWRTTGPRLAVRWLHGPGGAGKSRLAAQFAAEAQQDGWLAVVAVHGPGSVLPPPGSQDLRTEGHRGLVLIVDYADRWPLSHLTWLLSNALLHRPELPVRVLLLARSADGWPAVRAALANYQAGTSGQALEPLPATGERRAEMFGAARDGFADRYGLPDGSAIAPPASLDDPDMGLTLGLHMAALVAVDAYSRGKPPPGDMAGLTIYLLDREHLHWANLYNDGTSRTGPGAEHYATPPATMGRAVFAAALTGAVNRAAGSAVLDRVGLGERRDGILDDHRRCYPSLGGDDSTVLEPLYPDRLAEDFLALTTTGHTADYPAQHWAAGMAATVLAHVAPARPVTFLAEAARRWPHLGPASLFPVLRRDPRIAVDAGSAALTALASIPDVDMAVLEAVASRLPTPERPHIDLDVGAVAVLRKITPHLVATRDDPRENARALSMLAVRLAYVGEDHEALDVATEALRHWRAFAGDRAEALPDLAAALSGVAARLDSLGRPAEALPYVDEAVERYRTLLAVLPNLPAHLYAGTFGNLLIRQAVIMARLDRLDEALNRAQEALALFRRDPARYAAQEASATETIAYIHRMAGRSDQSAEESSHSEAQLRELARTDPARYLPALANLLVSRSEDLDRRRDHAGSLAAAEEAVALYRPLVRANPGLYRSQFADALRVAGKRAAAAGRLPEAVTACEEAVAEARKLTGPARDEQAGRSCYQLALAQNQMSDHLSALRWAEESAAHFRSLVERQPANLPDLALSLGYAAKIRHDRGLEPAKALAAAREAAEIFHWLSQRDEQMYGMYARTCAGLVTQIEGSLQTGVRRT
ncbi:tetratricopeptide repeat protein [Dactylosporangium salmoneum]|uniref:Tetratricopeptide repeat protein n=1 Tax=Dactylosporangium salmoneum TaxID=53361 RepID=A0ABP5UL48_9ACTN